MTAFFVSLITLLAIVGHSNAAYCVCKTGVSDAQLQKNIDYACANGADCTSITQSGPCYNPNTVKDHCNWAVNSYYQKKGPTAINCDFSGTATVSSTSPSQSSSCVYPTGGGNSGTVGTPTTGTPTTGTPTTGTPTTGTPTTGTPPSTGTPPTGTSTGTGTGTGSGTGSGMGTPTGSGMGTPTPISTVPGSYGLGPSGSSLDNTDSSAAPSLKRTSNMIIAVSLAILSLGLSS